MHSVIRLLMSKSKAVLLEIMGLLQLSLLLLLLPMKWMVAAMMAAAFHELGHCLAVLLCGGKMKGARSLVSGIRLEAVLPSVGTELICILAGPVFGSVPLLFYRQFPLVAVFALAQSMYNILPVYPLDGGRLVRLLAAHFQLDLKFCKFIEVGTLFIIFTVSMNFCRYLGLFPVVLAGGMLLWVSIRKTPCKLDDY